LQGTWLNNTITPLERPRKVAQQAFFTPEEAAEFENNYDSTESLVARLGAVEERVNAELGGADLLSRRIHST
jgi:hypothetical protein